MKTKLKLLFTLMAVLTAIVLPGCPDPATSSPDTVNIASIPGVTAPVTGATPVYTITETAQYTGTVAWNGTPATFASSTVYTATITVTAKAGFTLTGVTADFFTIAGATSDSNPVNSGMVTAVFPATGAAPDTVINIAAIPGVTAPVTGATPVTAITETAQYTGTVTWDPAVSNIFVSNTAYTATITLTAKTGYTLTGVAANFFTGANATAVTNPVNSGSVTAVFPATTANLAVVTDYTGTGAGTLKAVQGGTFSNGTANMTVSSFRMSQHEITRAQFVEMLTTDPSNATVSSGISDPVQMTNWYHAIAFCNKLSLAENLTPVYSVSVGGTPVNWSALTYANIPAASNGDWNAAIADWSANGYRLPTEAEWQFAAQGGNSSNNYTYAGSNTIGDVAVFGYYTSETGRTTTERTNPVGSKTANELGLNDMSGNVWEWCWDWSASYPGTAQTDYRGAASVAYRVARGGGWFTGAGGCTVAGRGNNSPYVQDSAFGFRIVRP